MNMYCICAPGLIPIIHQPERRSSGDSCPTNHHSNDVAVRSF